MELPMPTGTRTAGFFDAATSGSTTIASGIKMKRGDAGELSGPSQHARTSQYPRNERNGAPAVRQVRRRRRGDLRGIKLHAFTVLGPPS
jgi:hypothetical protein